jgi:hypothetical protein
MARVAIASTNAAMMRATPGLGFLRDTDAMTPTVRLHLHLIVSSNGFHGIEPKVLDRSYRTLIERGQWRIGHGCVGEEQN